jgi:hypothetical protein
MMTENNRGGLVLVGGEKVGRSDGVNRYAPLLVCHCTEDGTEVQSVNIYQWQPKGGWRLTKTY